MHAILALVNRSLSLDCRQRGTNFVRAFAIMAMVVVILVSQLVGMRLSGLIFASWLIWLNYVGITLAGLSWLASAISEEREQRTLSLLRLTDVNSASLILGKWLPRLVVVLMLLAIQFPMAVLSITLGGLTIHQLVTAFVGLVAYALLMTSIGVLWSCACESSRRASMMAGLTWLCLTSGPFMVKSFFPRAWYTRLPHWLVAWVFDPAYDVLDAVHSMSMFRKLFWVLAVGRSEVIFDAQTVGNTLVGFAALALAWFVLEYLTKYNLEATPPRPLRLSQLVPRFLKRKRRPGQTGRCWRNALAWKEFHFVAGSWRAVVTKILVYPAMALGVVSFSAGGGTSLSQMWSQIGGGTLFGVGIAALIVETTTMSARLFGAEVRHGTLHELMLLPLTPRQIGYGKLCGWAPALVPALLMVGVSPVFDAGMMGRLGNMLTPAGLLPIVGFAFFLHVAVYLSLYLRVGAVLAAFVLCYFLTGMVYVAAYAVGSRLAEYMIPVMCVVGTAVTVFLHYRIGPTVARVGQSPSTTV